MDFLKKISLKKLKIIQMVFFVLTILVFIATHFLDSYQVVSYFMISATFMLQSYNFSNLGKESQSQNYMILSVLALIYAIYKLVV